MLLLPNGSVIGTLDGDGAGTDWGLLTPDASGSYINGTWAKLANANDARLFDASQVLPDGRLFVAGGEYGSGGATGETYNPLTNTWTRLPSQPYGSFIDANSVLLPNGNVLIAPVAPSPSGYTTIFNPTSNTWSQGPKLYRGGSADEQSWVKLADDSIIMTDGNGTSERFIPSLNQWVNDGNVPVALFDGLYEEGAGIRLTDGRAFFLGATGHTAIYTPSGSTTPGTWAAGPDIPGGLGTDDAPLAMLPDGTVLCAVGPSGNYNGPTAFYIYNPGTNAFSAVSGAPGVNGPPFLSRMLDLPNGTVLYSSGGSGLYVYNPGTAPVAGAQPTITSLTPNADGSVTLSGMGLNGLNAGAAYGDDAQMDSNYPIVRLGAGPNVYYARTYGWTSTSVATGTLIESTRFTLPLGIPAGTYSVVTVANGVASNPASLTVSMTAGNLAPTVATAAAAVPATATTDTLSVLGGDDAGEPNLTYTWTTTSAPAGVSLPSFSANGTNAAKNTIATFHGTGTYTFKVYVTDAGGLSTTSSVTVIVNQVEKSLQVAPPASTLTANFAVQLTAQAMDQFGVAMAQQPAFNWSVVSGGGSVNTSGRYTAPATGTLATVGVADAAFSASAQVGVVDAPWSSLDIGSVGPTGIAYDSAGAFTLKGSGTDIWGTSDAFRYAYQTFTGNGMITARVAGVQNTDPWAKAGVMIRNSTAAGAQYAFMAITPGNGIALQDRTTSGGSAVQSSNTTGPTAPYWVRLIRTGTTITGYVSTDGLNWSSQGSVNISTLGSTVDFGLAVTAHNNSALCTATFSNVSVVPPSTTTTLATQAPNPSNATQSLTFTATVAGGVPNGETVTLLDTSDNVVLTTGTLAGGTATLTVPAGAVLAGTHTLVALYGGDSTFPSSQSAPYVQVVQVAVTAATINGNNATLAGAQRSMVDGIVYTFSEPVTLAATGAFTMAVHAGQTGTLPTLNWAAIGADTKGAAAQWVVTFSGTGVLGRSIANGVYDITLNTAAVVAEGNPAATIATRPADTFFRLFGDVNGDGAVNGYDESLFGLAIRTYNAIFDCNADGAVNGFDEVQAGKSIGHGFAGNGVVYTI